MYTEAAGTKLLATNCAACAKPLLDAESVEAGLGPVCREKFGVPSSLSAEAKSQINKLVYRIAVNQTGEGVVNDVIQISALGGDAIAKRIMKRLKAIEISEEDGRYVVKTPYSPGFVSDIKCVPTRRWDSERKVNTISMFTNGKKGLWKALKKNFAGSLAIGPKGAFLI